MSIHRRIRRRVPKLVPIGPAVWQLPKTFEFVPPTKTTRNASWCIEGRLVFSLIHSQMNPQTWTKLCAYRSSRLTASRSFWMFDPQTPQVPPLCLEGQFVWRISILRLICTCVPNFGANRSSRLVAFLEFVLRLVRLLAAVRADSRKTRQKQYLYIENHNSGPNMLTKT